MKATLAKVKNNELTINVKFPYDEKLVNLMRSFTKRHFDKYSKSWEITINLNNNYEIDFLLNNLSKYCFVIEEKIYEVIKANEEKKEEKIKSINFDFANINLYNFQKEGIINAIEKLNEVGSVLIADEMGLGKTIQALSVIYIKNLFPSLIITPATLKYNWKHEIKKFFKNEMDIVVLNNKKFSIGNNFTIVNYDILKKHIDEIKKHKFKSIIIDESHYIKNRKAQRTKYVKEICENIPNKILLTGTPILNRPVELVTQLEVMGVFNKIAKSFIDYAYKYCNAISTKYGLDVSGASNTLELNNKLKSICMIRRLKKEVLNELPDKNIITVYIPIELTNYKIYENKLIEKLSEIEIKNFKEKINDIKNNSFKSSILSTLNKMYYLTGMEKIPPTIEWIENFFENNPNEKLVVFAYHKEVQEKIYNVFAQKMSVCRIFAEDPPEFRMQQVYTFQNYDECKLIVCGIKTAAEGITLTSAKNMLFVELSWVPTILTQCEDRIYRIGQKNNVTIYYLIAEKTIDEDLYNVINQKKKIFNEVINGKKIKSNEDGSDVVITTIKEFIDRTKK